MIRNIHSKIWTPECSPPPGYKLVIHRYYTEIVPININIPTTPIKNLQRFLYNYESNDSNDNNESNEKRN
jgi:hypothetical protein